MKKTIAISLMFGATLNALAQDTLTVEQCMRYAVEHNHTVRQHELTLDNNKASKVAAIGAFMPAIEVNIGVQYNFGRAIDPETNTYTNVNTFYNQEGVYASLPIFDGMKRVHMLQARKANVLMGENALQAQRDRTALAIYQSYVDVIYYQGTSEMARAKRDESEMMLKQTKAMEEIGQKSAADVAQMEAQLAGDEYEVVRQENMLEKAMLTLKSEMNYDGEFKTTTNMEMTWTSTEQTGDNTNCEIEEAYNEMEAAKYAYKAQRSDMMPNLSVNAGVSTTYYKTLGTDGISFSDQIKNNRGEYVSATISIPIFSRLSAVTNVRKAKNDYMISREKYEAKQRELNQLKLEAEMDAEGYERQAVQMEKKVASDSIAYTLTKRKYEEGLTSSIEVKQSAITLLQSRATLLQSRLMAVIKKKLVRYYNGETMY